MPNVIVNPPSVITVRVGPAAPAEVTSTSTFFGASDQLPLIQEALNTANLALATAITANAAVQGAEYAANVAYAEANTALTIAYQLSNTALANSGSLITTNGVSQLFVANTTPSISNSTGSLVIGGGIGVSGNVYANGIYITSSNFTANAITIDAGTF